VKLFFETKRECRTPVIEIALKRFHKEENEMATHVIDATGNSDKIVERLLQRVSKEQLKSLVDAAAANSGQAVANVSYEPGDDICPTFKFPYPFPPRFDEFLNQAAVLGKVRLFPYGILNPEGVLVQVGVGRVNG
jgi:hypothetical protein